MFRLRGEAYDFTKSVFGGIMSLHTFLSHKYGSQRNPYIDWSDDGCSAPNPMGMTSGWNSFFDRACKRHDFGYRNAGPKSYLQAGSENYEAVRARIDDIFLSDMYYIVDTDRTGMNKTAATAAASVYYRAVRAAGKSAF